MYIVLYIYYINYTILCYVISYFVMLYYVYIFRYIL